MKLDGNYRMSKPVKTYLNMLMDDPNRSEIKKLFCEAEYYSVNARRKMSVKVMEQETEDTSES